MALYFCLLFHIVSFDIKALVVPWHQFVYTLVIPCGCLAIQPGHDNILQVIIITFDIKALVQLHEETSTSHWTPETNDPLQKKQVRGLYAQTCFTFWMAFGPYWKVTGWTTSAFNVKSDYDEDLKDAVVTWIARQPHGMTSVFTNWGQGTCQRRLCGKVD